MTFCVNLPIAHAVLLDVKYLNWIRLPWLPFTKVRRIDFDEQSLVVVVPQNQNVYSLWTFQRNLYTRSMKLFGSDGAGIDILVQ